MFEPGTCFWAAVLGESIPCAPQDEELSQHPPVFSVINLLMMFFAPVRTRLLGMVADTKDIHHRNHSKQRELSYAMQM